MQQHADNLIAGGAPHADNLASMAGKASPGIAVASAPLFGMTPEQWVTALTIIYLVLMIGHFVYTKAIRPHLAKYRGP